MSSKARSLRERMSIDPDAPSPVTERRPRPRAVEPAVPPAPASRAPAEDTERPRREVADAPTAEPPPAVPSSSVGGDAVGATPRAVEQAEPAAASTTVPAPAPPAADPSRTKRSRSTRSATRRTRRSGKEGVDWESALDDPAISEGGNGYRSFYVSDEVFARFRAAVYWTARRPDVDDVPDNMSVGIEDYMDSVATDLERRFNAKAVFPPTPDQVRAHRKRQNPS